METTEPVKSVEEIVKEFRAKFQREDGLIDKYVYVDNPESDYGYDVFSTPDAIAEWLTQTLHSYTASREKEMQLKLSNYFQFLTAAVYYINNPKTKMDIPSMIYESVSSKVKQFPKDRMMTEREAHDLVLGNLPTSNVTTE